MAYLVLLDMPRAKRFARIAITLPEEDLAAADRLALTHDRSRSWIVAEAIRRYAAASSDAPPHRVAEGTRDVASPVPAIEPGIGPSRVAQLKRDLLLTPEARVREAELTLQTTETRGKTRTHHLMAFDQYEDFLNWKRTRDVRR